MGAEWRHLSFSQAVDINPRIRLQRGESYPFVDMASVSALNRSVQPKEIREYKGGGSRFIAGDTLMARITPCLENGKIARYAPDRSDIATLAHGSTEFYVIRGRDKISDNDFAYYLARSEEVRSYAISQMSGTSGRQRVPKDCFDHLIIALPSLPEQRAIAHILGTLDDKIELNRRMNETLEAMARALFKSWFVDFDPVRAKMAGRDTGLPSHIAELFPDRLVPSELGEIPEGWGAGCLGQIVQQRKEKLKDGKATALSAVASGELVSSDDYFTKRVYSMDMSNYLVVEEWDVAYNPARINIGSVGMLKEAVVGAVSPVYVVARPRPEFRWFVEFLLKRPTTNNWVNVLASGSVRQSLSYSAFASIPCVIPTTATLFAFDEKWSSFRKAIISRQDEIRTLSTLRDTMLPKLISGEIRVSDAVSFLERAL